VSGKLVKHHQRLFNISENENNSDVQVIRLEEKLLSMSWLYANPGNFQSWP